MSEHGRRILIVDDDADIVANLSDILTDIGYETETACDGPTALEKFDECASAGQTFDLCLLDFKMPGMDGAELLARIQVKKPHLKAIMITAYAGEDGVQRAEAAGSWKVLKKPVDMSVLLGLVNEAVA